MLFILIIAHPRILRVRVFITLHFDLSPAAMATSGAATGSSSSDVLPDNEQNENSNDQESDDESQENATPPRKCKEYTFVFRKEYAKLFSWATESKQGPTYAFCVKCSRGVSLGLRGTKDLRRHEQTSLYGRCDRASSSCMSFQSYFGGPNVQ